MRVFTLVVLLGIAVAVWAQQTSPKFEPATVTSVQEQKSSGQAEGAPRQYKVGLKTATQNYVVLFTPTNYSRTVEYSVGAQVSILVGKKSIRINDLAGRSIEMPIVSASKIAPQTTPQ